MRMLGEGWVRAKSCSVCMEFIWWIFRCKWIKSCDYCGRTKLQAPPSMVLIILCGKFTIVDVLMERLARKKSFLCISSNIRTRSLRVEMVTNLWIDELFVPMRSIVTKSAQKIWEWFDKKIWDNGLHFWLWGYEIW